jgi:hypothetical protein
MCRHAAVFDQIIPIQAVVSIDDLRLLPTVFVFRITYASRPISFPVSGSFNNVRKPLVYPYVRMAPL